MDFRALKAIVSKGECRRHKAYESRLHSSVNSLTVFVMSADRDGLVLLPYLTETFGFEEFPIIIVLHADWNWFGRL